MNACTEIQAPQEIRTALIAAIPNLRAFAISLCGNTDRADDLVQETLMKAWGNIGFFYCGYEYARLALHNFA